MDDIENTSPNSLNRKANNMKASDAAPQEKRRRIQTNQSLRDDTGGDSAADTAADTTVIEVAGRVALLKLENFMCHGNLEVPFNVRDNNCFYIGGPNGSGKSAIFAALNLGLGGRGSNNDRGNSVKSYIKEGKNKAKISITLTNRGQNSIKDHGDYIIVERTLTQSSTSYSLYSVEGRGQSRKEVLFSKKKSDLDKLLVRFGIQLSNPIFWMSQDKCRHFLSQMEPSKLYEIFNKATELEATENAYKELESVLTDVKVVKDVMHQTIMGKQQKYEDMKNQRKLLKTEATLHQSMATVQWVKLWCPLRDATRQREDLDKKIEEHGKSSELLKLRLHTACEDIAAWKIEAVDLNEKITEKADNVRQFTDEMERVKSEYGEVRKRDNSLVLSLKQAENEKRSHKNNIRLMQEQIREKERLASGDAKRKELEGYRSKLNSLKDKEEETSAKRRLAEQEAAMTRPELDAVEDKAKELSRGEYEMSGRLSDRKRYLERGEAVAKNQMARFGEFTPDILNIIEANAKMFEHKPKGPLGRFVTVLDPKCCFAVEEAMHKFQLTSYIVNSKKDDDTFKRLLTSKGIRIPATTITRFGLPPHDVRANEPSSKWLTVLRAVSISDNDVRNTLIDMKSIESIIIFDSDDTMRDVMNERCPEKCSKAFSLAGSNAFGSRLGDGGIQGQYRFYACHQQPEATILAKHLSFDKKAILNEIQQIAKDKEALTQEMVQVRSRRKELENTYRLASNRQISHEKQLDLIRKEIKIVSRQLEAIDQDETDTVIASLKASIDQYESEIVTSETSINKLQAERESLKAELLDHQEYIKQLEADRETHISEGLTFKDSLSNIKNKLDQCHTTIERLDRSKQELDNIARNFDAQLLQSDKDLDAAETTAKEAELLPTPPTWTNPPDFDLVPPMADVLAEIDRNTEELVKLQQTILNDRPPTDDVMDAFYNDYKSLTKRYRSVNSLFKKLHAMLQTRQEAFPVIRHNIQQRLTNKFRTLIHLRDFVGILSIDDNNRSINIRVDTHKKDNTEDRMANAPRNSAMQDLKGLSGGERSYTTAAFVISLWEVMDAPFRCMDEFDVFMDNMNRKVIMDLLVLEATKTYSHNQFIFFTPQGINELGKQERCAVFQMKKVRE